MIVSTVYLPGTTVNVQHQHALTRSICAGHKRCPCMIGTVRWWFLVIARSQVGALHRARFSKANRGRSPPRTPAGLQDGRHPCQAWRGPRLCGVASRQPPRGLPRAAPGASLANSAGS